MKKEKREGSRSESVFSLRFRAGKRRTYFFDVRPAKSNDYFLVITESKKRPDQTYERYKIFLYKEDFKKFLDSLNETFQYIRTELMPDFDFDAQREPAVSEADERGKQETDSDDEPAGNSNGDQESRPENSSHDEEERW